MSKKEGVFGVRRRFRWAERDRLTKKVEPPPTRDVNRDVNRDSGTASANHVGSGSWLGHMVVVSKNVIGRMAGKSCRCNDMMRCVNQKCLDAITNLVWREPFWKQMKCNQKSSFCTPICEIKSNLFRVKYLRFAGVFGNERSLDSSCDALRQSGGI
ncbi:MAG: hypothetical protein RLZZ350_787 [Verrucomicrobiota bacterium]|jgi:hypothetical protein